MGMEWDCSFCGAKEGQPCAGPACQKAANFRAERDGALVEVNTLKLQIGEKQKQYDIACNRIENLETGRNVINRLLEDREATLKLLRDEAELLVSKRDDALRQINELKDMARAAYQASSILADERDTALRRNDAMRKALSDLIEFTKKRCELPWDADWMRQILDLTDPTEKRICARSTGSDQGNFLCELKNNHDGACGRKRNTETISGKCPTCKSPGHPCVYHS